MRDLRFLSRDFNPRSLAGATLAKQEFLALLKISIHAPSRERLSSGDSFLLASINFNPRSLAGATDVA